MLNIAGAFVCIVVSLLWYMPGIRLQGDDQALQKKDYLRTALLYGLCIGCGLIIAAEMTWDIVVGVPGEGELGKSITADVFRAALMEEAFKFLGVFLAIRSIRPKRKIDYMMIAGMIGMVYGIVEKIAAGNMISILVGIVLPIHLLWQLNQGGHYFEYKKAKLKGDISRARKELFITLAVPFAFHAFWDSALDVCGYLIGEKLGTWADISGGLLLLVLVVLVIVYMVKTLKKMRATARNSDTLENLAA